MLKNMGYIYLRKNKINGKCYIGQTVNVKRRNNDWNNLNIKYGGHTVENARKKYGTDGFTFEILKECPNDEMNEWEMYYIKKYNSKAPNGYNATDGGDSTCERTEEIKMKISISKRGKKHSVETKTKMSVAQKGKSKPKVADALKGRKRPDITAALKGKYNTKCSKPVEALDKTTGKVVYVFPSAKEAERHGFYNSNISDCCNGKRKSHKGYIWRYVS